MFIRLTQGNKPIYVNLDKLSMFGPVEGEDYHAEVIVDQGCFYVSETVEEICKLIRLKEPPGGFTVSEIKQPLDMPLEDMKFSTRAYHVLTRKDVKTLGDILKLMHYHDKLRFIGGMGETTKNEIVSKIHACGYKFDWEEQE